MITQDESVASATPRVSRSIATLVEVIAPEESGLQPEPSSRESSSSAQIGPTTESIFILGYD